MAMMHRLERVFLAIAGAMLVVGLGAIGVSVFAGDIHLPHPVGRVDPRLVASTPPFDQPGLRELAPGQYEAVIRAQIWQFAPLMAGTNDINIKAGDTITFTVTSSDVIHGFLIRGTDINAMIVPGQVTRVSHTFHQPGEYLIICHEYCGIGHHEMFARVVVA
jgi:cytochrome c oxidase subunit 2